MILGKIISIDDWVPERPPKTKLNTSSNNLPIRVPSPDLPPPPPSVEPAFCSDDALPLPPPEVLKQESELKMTRRNSFAGQGMTFISRPPISNKFDYYFRK